MVPMQGNSLLLTAALAVVALIYLIAVQKLNPFVTLIVVSLALGVVVGMPMGGIVKAFETGVGNTLGHIALVVGLGTMLGKMMAESGGAEVGARRPVLHKERVVDVVHGVPVLLRVDERDLDLEDVLHRRAGLGE